MVRKRSNSKSRSQNNRNGDAWRVLENLKLIAKGERPQQDSLTSKPSPEALTWSDLRAVSVCHSEILPGVSDHVGYDANGILTKLEKRFPESAMPYRYKVGLLVEDLM